MIHRPHRLLFSLVVCLLSIPAAGAAQVCSLSDDMRGAVPPEPTEPSYESMWVSGGDAATIPLGIGHLYFSPANYERDLAPDGYLLGQVELPLSATAEAEPSAWIAGGWIVDGGTPRPLGTIALVETGYEETSFIVLEASNGWLRIRYDEGEDGLGWTPECALAEGPVTLEFAEWGDWLTSGEISPLFFRADEPGALRERPSRDASPLAAIGEDYMIEPLEVRGDWMRVRVSEPSDYCEFDLEPPPERREGWIRWFAPAAGPLVWYYSRGC